MLKNKKITQIIDNYYLINLILNLIIFSKYNKYKII
jgi:hypothetical protein